MSNYGHFCFVQKRVPEVKPEAAVVEEESKPDAEVNFSLFYILGNNSPYIFFLPIFFDNL